MKELIGKTIEGIFVDGEYQEYLTFETIEGPVHYGVDGDCCSTSYFAEILNVAKIAKKKPVTAVEELETLDGEGTRGEYDSIYGYRVRMGEESLIISFRNSSNGYYGGSCFHTDSIPDRKKAHMVVVNRDYRAS